MLNKNFPLLITNHFNTVPKYNLLKHWIFYLTGLIQSCGEIYLASTFDKWDLKININIRMDIMDNLNILKLISLF